MISPTSKRRSSFYKLSFVEPPIILQSFQSVQGWIKAGFWGEVRTSPGMTLHLPWDDFVPSPEIFSTSPKNFCTSPNNVINFKRHLYKLVKKYRTQT